jgi:hypothetical protein
MSEELEMISRLCDRFKVTIRPKDLTEYKTYAKKIKDLADCKNHNLYVNYFLKEKYPYLNDIDLANILEIEKSNYGKYKKKWEFEVKTYDDVKENIDKLKEVLSET